MAIFQAVATILCYTQLRFDCTHNAVSINSLEVMSICKTPECIVYFQVAQLQMLNIQGRKKDSIVATFLMLGTLA